MHRILPSRRSWPLHGVALSRVIEQRATADLPPHTLMRRAGLGIARLAIAAMAAMSASVAGSRFTPRSPIT